ncbi:MAG: ABC transporter permease [Deltaproteobacteria bacterium]|nr:ABC transporter permease [Deltaproteobacteria bacterium]
MAGEGNTTESKTRLAKDVLAFLGFLLGVLVVWEAVVRYFALPAYLLPSVFDVLRQLGIRFGLLMKHSQVTIIETLAGLALGGTVGTVTGVAIVYVRLIRTGLYPLIVGFQAVPKVAVVPLFVIWFGYGLLPKIAMSFLISFFPMVVATIAGLTSVPYSLIEHLKSMNATEWQTFRKLRVPNSLPYLMDGFKISLPLAVIGAIVGEFAASEEGLGAIIMLASSTQDTPLIFAGLLVISVISMLMFGLIVLLDRLVWWRTTS